MKPTNPLYELYWKYVESGKETKQFLRVHALLTKYIGSDPATNILCELKEKVESDAFLAGFKAASKIFAGGEAE